MPVSKPNRRWSRSRRERERRLVAPQGRSVAAAGDLVHDGRSVIDPLSNAGRTGRLVGMMLRSALADSATSRTPLGALLWSLLATAMLVLGALLLYGSVTTGAFNAYSWLFSIAMFGGGLAILNAEFGRALRRLRGRAAGNSRRRP